MTSSLHEIDIHYAALPDQQIEAMWRYAVVHDPDAREPLLRQLVLRAGAVIEQTCRREGAARDFTEGEHERACDESTQRLLSRLRVDESVRDVRALAHQIASEVVADPDRRREPREPRFALTQRPALRVVGPEDGR
jgi:hypothetical protein